MQGMHDRRSSVYCLVPRGTDDSALHRVQQILGAYRSPATVVVERREQERRHARERRKGWPRSTADTCRRRVRNADGRRVADRRAEIRPWVQGAALAGRLSDQFGRVRLVQVTPAEDAETADSLRLVVRFQSGDSSAFPEIYSRFFDRVYRFLTAALADRHAAEDRAQEVFVRVFRALPSYEFRGVPFEAWLFRVARNQVFDERQRAQLTIVEEPALLSRRQELVDAAGGGSPDAVDDRDLLRLVDRLPLPQRQVIVLRHMADLDWRTIAFVLERSPEAVRQLEQRAFLALRRRLEALGRTPNVQRLPLVRLEGVSPVAWQRRHALAYSIAA